MLNDDKTLLDFEMWLYDPASKIPPMLPKELAWKAWKACAAIKDAEIEQEKLYSSMQFDQINALKAEIAARDLMLKNLVADVASIIARAEQAMKQRTLVDIGTRVADILYVGRKALAHSEHIDGKALEKALLEAELKGLSTPDFEFVEKHNAIKDKLAELNKE